MGGLGKTLVGLGAALLILGFGLMLLERWGISLGRLPGDLIFRRKNLVVFFPLGSMVLLSLGGTLLLYLWQRWGR